MNERDQILADLPALARIFRDVHGRIALLPQDGGWLGAPIDCWIGRHESLPQLLDHDSYSGLRRGAQCRVQYSAGLLEVQAFDIGWFTVAINDLQGDIAPFSD